MSVEALAIALHHSRSKGSAKLVLIGIANHDGDGGSWPSVATLGKYAHIERRNVQKALVELERLGEIRRMVSAGGDHSTADHRRPNLYQFKLTCPHDCDRSRNHRTPHDEAVQTTLEGLSVVDGASVATRGQLSTEASVATRDGASVATPKPSLEPLTNQVLNASPDARGVKDENDGLPADSQSPAIAAAALNEAMVRDKSRCPNSPRGHLYLTNAQVCDRCGLHVDQYLDRSGEIKWRETKSA